MSPRSWFSRWLLLLCMLAACQPIRAVDLTPTPVAVVPSTTTSGMEGCQSLLEPPSDLIITPAWQAGEARRYQASYSRTPIKNGDEQPTLTTSYALSVTVLQASEAGYVMEWRYVAMFPNPQRIRLEYTVSPYGEFIAVRNVDELKDLIDAVATQMALAPGNPIPVATADDPPPPHEQALAVITNDIRAFHAPYGLYFTDTVEQQWDTVSILPPNEMAGTDNNNVMLARYDPANGCLDLFQNSKWNPKTWATFQSITVESTARYDLDPDSGWPRNVSIKHTSIVGGEGQVEELSLTSASPAR